MIRNKGPVESTTTGFRAQGYVPRESETYCVGSAKNKNLATQCTKKLQGCAVWSRKRQSTLDDMWRMRMSWQVQPPM